MGDLICLLATSRTLNHEQQLTGFKEASTAERSDSKSCSCKSIDNNINLSESNDGTYFSSTCSLMVGLWLRKLTVSSKKKLEH